MADLAGAPSPTHSRGPRRRIRRGLAAFALAAAVLAVPSTARAEGRDDRPWGRGTLVPTFGLGAGGFFSDIANINFGLGFGYYIVNGLSAGLSFSDTVLIYRSSIKARFPGIEDQLPTNIFDITPTLQYVFFRSRRFSPYVFGGVGPVFFNNGAGTYGQWTAGPGVFLNVAGPLYVNVGVGFSGLFPTDQCQDALTYTPSDPTEGGVLLDLCSFRWGPQLGVVVAFGGGRKGRRERRREREERGYSPSPSSNPMPAAVESEPEPAPMVGPEAPVTSPEPEPAEVSPPPVEPEPGPPTESASPPAGTEPATESAPPVGTEEPATEDAPVPVQRPEAGSADAPPLSDGPVAQPPAPEIAPPPAR